VADGNQSRSKRGAGARRVAIARNQAPKSKSSGFASAWVRIPHALVDDRRLSADARSLMIYRLSRTNSWTLHWKDLQKRFGWSKSRFYNALNELKTYGYLERTQPRPVRGRWARAEEALNRGAMGVAGRQGFQRLPRSIVDDRRLSSRDLLSLAAMNSHAPGRPFYIHNLARLLGCHSDTARKSLQRLVRLGLVGRMDVRGGAGKFEGALYQLADQRARGIAINHRANNRETVCRETADEDAYEGLPSTQDYKERTNYAFREAKSAPDEDADVDLAWLDDLPEKLQEEFELYGSVERIEETYEKVSDSELLEMLLDATGGRVNARLKMPEGLGTIRYFMTTGVRIGDVFDIIRRRIGRKPGKFLNGWLVIAMPIATDILIPGFNEEDLDDDES
jgi:hypothetical protein